MSEWEVKSLAEVVSQITDKVSVGKDPTKPYIGLEHIPSDGAVLLGAGNADDSISTNNVFKRGDVLFGKLRPRLRKCVRVSFDGYCSTDVLVLRAYEDTDPVFASKLLSSDAVFTEAIRTEEGTKMPRCSWRSLRNLSLPCPEPPEQRHIATILTTLDEVIEATEKLVEKHQQIKAGLMHDLFTRGLWTRPELARGDHKGLPCEATAQEGQLRPPPEEAPGLYQDSQLGFVPKTWAVKRLGVILRESGGYLQTGPFGSQLHAYEYQNEGVPVVMPQDINDGIVSEIQIARILEARAQELARHRMRPGDVVIARRGELSRAAAIAPDQEGWLCGTGCFLLRLTGSALSADFASCVYRHDLIQRQIEGMAVGTTMPSLNNGVMERLWFPFPSTTEQTEIIRLIVDADNFLVTSTTHLAKLRQQKQGLMHDLLTGRVQVRTPSAQSY